MSVTTCIQALGRLNQKGYKFQLQSWNLSQNKERTVDLIQLLEGFPSTSEILGVIHSIAKLSVEVQVHNACNPTTLEVEAGRPRSLRTSLAT